ncbi:hypothetical protein OIU79_009903 [Salix purpurea]|uniref:Uncharacterized protein n=1 Tax=Salix purpurea TaxID=77065 RepID=A0A9Q0QED9_SALPP|nr:hypothetical protein OIU79_009903 [Salix purpurea]
MGPIVLTQLATGLSMLAGAALVKSVMDQKAHGRSDVPVLQRDGTGRLSLFPLVRRRCRLQGLFRLGSHGVQ